MNISRLRMLITKELFHTHNFVYRGGRGCDESFRGQIIKVYSRVFLIMTIDGNLKCFSYSDFLIKSLKITCLNEK